MKVREWSAKVKQIRVLALLVVFNLFTQYGKAQYNDEPTFLAGATAGFNFSQVDGDNFAGYHRAALNLGLVVFAKTSNKTALSTEMLLSQKGSRAGATQLPRRANDQQTILTDYRIKLNYLEIPLLFNYFDSRKNNFGAGLSYGQLVKSKETYRDGNGNVFENDAKVFPFKKRDVMLIFNGSVGIYKNLQMNIRFGYSLLPIRDQFNYITGRSEQYSRMWTTRLIYMF